MKIFVCSLSFFILMSCNKALFVNRDNVIVKQKGYLMVIANDEVLFLHAKIDTNRSLTQNLIANKCLQGHYVHYLPLHTLQLLAKYADSNSSLHSMFIPVVYEYRHIKERNKQLRIQDKRWDKHWLNIEGEKVHYRVKRGPDYRFVNIRPYVTVRKQISLFDTTR